MHGLKFKTTLLINTLCIATLLSSATLASNHSSKNMKFAMYTTSAGCMGCHQGESSVMLPEELLENNGENQKAQKGTK